MPKFKDKDWVRSARYREKAAFVGQIVGMSQGEYIVRDGDRVKWLRTEDQLTLVDKDAA
ncbi:hypothetical protein [Bradyrhizobium sp. DASA03007]|uniref:hypothetical protein n=1 Tax=unclassified Bradyrhizobium TaxID=2631580 RepID=UPI003F703060